MVVKSRAATYRARRAANLVRRLVDGKHKEWHTDDPGGVGRQTEVEVAACPACAAKLQPPATG